MQVLTGFAKYAIECYSQRQDLGTWISFAIRNSHLEFDRSFVLPSGAVLVSEISESQIDFPKIWMLWIIVSFGRDTVVWCDLQKFRGKLLAFRDVDGMCAKRYAKLFEHDRDFSTVGSGPSIKVYQGITVLNSGCINGYQFVAAKAPAQRKFVK